MSKSKCLKLIRLRQESTHRSFDINDVIMIQVTLVLAINAFSIYKLNTLKSEKSFFIFALGSLVVSSWNVFHHLPSSDEDNEKERERRGRYCTTPDTGRQMLESALLLCMLVVVDKPNRATAAAPDWAPSVIVVVLVVVTLKKIIVEEDKETYQNICYNSFCHFLLF